MGDNNLSKVVAGNTGFVSQINQYYDAMKQSLLPRSSAGIPTDAAGGLGDAARRWLKGYFSGKQPFDFNNEPNGGTPSGVMMAYTGHATIAPYGWLIADGKTIGNTGSGADYEGDEYEYLFNLYKVVTEYGNAGTEVFASGDTVLIPDMSNCFVRNLDPAGSRSLGEYEADQMLAHTHGISGNSTAGAATQALLTKTNATDNSYQTTSAGGGSETVPKNKTFPYIIKI